MELHTENVVENLRLLVQHAFGEPNSSSVDQAVQYCLRILGSRITPTVVRDEFQIREACKQEIERNGDRTDVVRFESLYGQLQSFSIMKNKCSMLYLLSRIARDKNENQHSRIPISPVAFSLSNLAVDISRALPAVSDYTKVSSVSHTSLSTSSSVSADDHVISCQTPYTDDSVCSETTLLRDIMFVLQGIDGTHIKYDVKADEYSILPQISVASCIRDLVKHVCMAGWFYNRIATYIQHILQKNHAGVVEQSFCSVLQQELTDYFKLIAVLESQVIDANSNSKGSSFTLKRLYVWIQNPLTKLKIMATLVEGGRGLFGGALVSSIYQHLAHGNAFVLNFVTRIMKEVSKPIFQMIIHWMYSGDLYDPREEFFVASDNEVKEENDLWRLKYSVRPAMVPLFLGDDLAEKIFRIGKSINFLRVCCKDSEFSAFSGNILNIAKGISFGENEAIERAVKDAAEIANNRLLHIFHTQYRLQDHCMAIKKYLLLGQGDFIQHLMDLLFTELSRPALAFQRHNLLTFVQTAIRSSNAQYEDPEILKKIDIVNTLCLTDKDSGWDVFSLDYKISAPLSVIITPECRAKYLRMFNFLWRIKRVEHCLYSTWQSHMSHSYRLRKIKGLAKALHSGNVIRTEMMHFIENLTNYIMFEVLESSWLGFVQEMKVSTDLDMLILAHERYLCQVMNKALLGSGNAKLIHCLNALFDCIIEACRIQEKLFAAGASILRHKKERHEEMNRRKKEGKWAITQDDDEQDEKICEISVDKFEQLELENNRYRVQFLRFLDMLRQHNETDVKMLMFRLYGQNEYYQSKTAS